MNPGRHHTSDTMSCKWEENKYYLAIDIASCIVITWSHTNIIASILQIIFQISLNTGKVSTDWTTALVMPIFKKGSHTLPSNYQPLSLTCITSKVFEHINACSILKHLENNNILNGLQYGFRQGRLSVLNDLTINYDRSMQTVLIITNFAKTFDVVPHRRLY